VRRRTQTLAFALAAMAALPACVSGPDPSQAKSFTKGKLAGRVNGNDWTYKHAYVDPTIETPDEDDFVFVFLPYKPKNPCPAEDEVPHDKATVMVSAPKVTKQTKLKAGTGRTLVFQFEKKGAPVATSAKKGKVKLTSIAPRTVKGKVMGAYNRDNYINGTFTAVVCDVAEMTTAYDDE
jgi:hypothetical protein